RSLSNEKRRSKKMTLEANVQEVTTSEMPVIASMFQFLWTQKTETKSLPEFIGDELSRIPEVEAVFATRRGKVFYIVTVVDAFDSKVREQIYKRELRLSDEFSDLTFDFNVLSRRGRPLNQVAGKEIGEACFSRP